MHVKDYNVGDEIVLLVDEPDFNACLHEGDTGTITFVRQDGFDSSYDVGVDFGRNINGHDCFETCEDGNGWMLYERQFEVLTDASEMECATDDEMSRFLSSLSKSI